MEQPAQESEDWQEKADQIAGHRHSCEVEQTPEQSAAVDPNGKRAIVAETIAT